MTAHISDFFAFPNINKQARLRLSCTSKS